MKADNELYRKLRGKSCAALWLEDVPRLLAAQEPERSRLAAVVRALASAAAERGSDEEKERTRIWLRKLLHDESAKIRRYAAAALPKLGDDTGAETAILSRLEATQEPRERAALADALEKVGGEASLRAAPAELEGVRSRLEARAARIATDSAADLEAVLPAGLEVTLHTRTGLADLAAQEAKEILAKLAEVNVMDPSRVQLLFRAPFRLIDILQGRCWSHLGIVIGDIRSRTAVSAIRPLAARIAAPLSTGVLRGATVGPVRYRIQVPRELASADFALAVAEEVRALAPDLLNDSRETPWTVMLFPIVGGVRAELRPRLTPDPRFAYRLGDIPAASHPPLAAAMARLAGKRQGEVIWDPFCGSGLELIERARLGGVERLIGTDIDAAAIDIARRNLEAAQLTHVRTRLMVSNFKDYAKIPELTPGTVTLVLSNPPMGRRLEVPDLRGLFLDLFRAATDALAPGGRLIFPNPLKLDAPDHRLQLVHRNPIDMGGYSCQLERWDRK